VAGEVVAYAAVAQRQADVSAGGRTFENAAVSGTQAALPAIRDISLARGRFLTRGEETSGAQVVVVGRDIAATLFPATDALGQSVRIGRRAFRIIGIQTPQGTAGGQSLDRFVYMPLVAFERTFGAPASLQVFATGESGHPIQAAEDRARISMRARRHLGPGAEDTFDIITPEAARSFVERITQQVSAAGPPISLMALLAAVVVVANTTLVSVTQRTREIGVRRAVGASRRSVIVETLSESTVVALVGGGIGLLVAVAVLTAAQAALDIELRLEWPVTAASLAAAALSGLAAGWYPARRAASTDVVNALRLE
jgi:putative ABC transport system permease protein